MYNPNEDGITHINIYSKGKTELGRWLSNFAYAPINIGKDGCFNSIEGYWYWLSCKDHRLRLLSGFQAKNFGRKCGGKDRIFDNSFREKIKKAITIKLETYPKKYQELKQSTLPLVHYYNFNGKIVVPNDCDWIIEHIEFLRKVDHKNCKNCKNYYAITSKISKDCPNRDKIEICDNWEPFTIADQEDLEDYWVYDS
jgi:RNA polymerase subunit RPABC4/transcription elongation factor Spt4